MPAGSARQRNCMTSTALPLQRAGKGTALEVLLVFFWLLVPRLEKAIRNAFKLAAVTVAEISGRAGFERQRCSASHQALPYLDRWSRSPSCAAR
jgi:hypothetical protein